MHDNRTWCQRTGVKTLSHPPTLLDGISQQAIVCANVDPDLWCHIASLNYHDCKN